MTPAHADTLAADTARDGTETVVQSMLRDVSGTDTPGEAQVYAVMDSLEAMAEHRPDEACWLMTALWPVASELRMHDICDSVDLWIVHHPSAAVLTYLRQLVLSENNQKLKRHWEGLLEWVCKA